MPETAESNGGRPSRQSLHKRVMADEGSRNAYFNTIQGMLRGNPSHEDMDSILRVLNDNRIAYLYEPDSNYPRPAFYSQGSISMGLAEISQTVEELAGSS